MHDGVEATIGVVPRTLERQKHGNNSPMSYKPGTGKVISMRQSISSEAGAQDRNILEGRLESQSLHSWEEACKRDMNHYGR
jgi:hypothetical protein